MDTATAQLLRETLREALSDSGSTDVAHTLAELGWDDVVADDEATATCLLFEEHGRALATSHALDAVVLRAVNLPGLPHRVVYPPPTGHDTAVDGVVLGAVAPGDRLLAPAGSDGEPRPVLVDVSAGTSAAAVAGLDADARWHTVSGLERVEELPADPEAWSRALAAARRALASELLGIGHAALALAIEHVSDRTQFGRPVGSFQAVRHRLAEAYTWLAGTEALIAASWNDRSAWSAAAAKAHAGQTHALVLRHTMQVCGAMGLTWEHDMHRYARRGFVLDVLLGRSDDLSAAAGRQLLDGLEPPRIPEIGEGTAAR